MNDWKKLQRLNQLLCVAGICAVLGFLIGGTIALRLPLTYISTASIRFSTSEAPRDQDSFRVQLKTFVHETFRDEDTLGNIVRKEKLYGYQSEADVHSLDGRINKMRLAIQYGPANYADGTVAIAFADRDAGRSQRILARLLEIMANASATEPGTRLEILTSPTLPSKPNGPNRMLFASFGIAIGLFVGLAADGVLCLIRGIAEAQMQRAECASRA